MLLTSFFRCPSPPPPPIRWQSIGAAGETSATSSLGVDHATKLSAIPSQTEIYCLLKTTARKLLEVAYSLGDEVRMVCLKSCIYVCMYVYVCEFVCVSLSVIGLCTQAVHTHDCACRKLPGTACVRRLPRHSWTLSQCPRMTTTPTCRSVPCLTTSTT